MDVLVVGAGPVGLTMAAELARHGVRVRIIDKVAEPTRSSKALGVHARSLEMLDQMGVIDPFLSKGHRIHGMRAVLGHSGKTAEINFHDLDSPYPFILDIPQYETETILTHHLSSYGVNVERQTELVRFIQNSETVDVVLQDADGTQEYMNVPWLVGCDGAHSTVRHQLGIAFDGSQYPETFLLGDVRIEWDLPEDRMHLALHPDGLLAAFPYGNERYRLMANLPAHAAGESGSDATLAELISIATARSSVPMRISEPVWITHFHSHLRHARQTRDGRVFLVGDAAHIHSPAGGQGMNTGMQDAHNLAWKLALAIKGVAEESLLDTYQEERLPVAESVLKLSDGLLTVATKASGIVRGLRDNLAPLLLRSAFAQHHMTEQLSEIGIHYRQSSIVSSKKSGIWGAGVHAGDRTPDVKFLDALGNEIRFYNLFTSPKHVALVFGRNAALVQSVHRWLNPYLTQIELYWVRPQAVGQDKTEYTLITDPQHSIGHRFGFKDEGLLIIRPDGYVGYIADAPEEVQVGEYFRRIFHS